MTEFLRILREKRTIEDYVVNPKDLLDQSGKSISPEGFICGDYDNILIYPLRDYYLLVKYSEYSIFEGIEVYQQLPSGKYQQKYSSKKLREIHKEPGTQRFHQNILTQDDLVYVYTPCRYNRVLQKHDMEPLTWDDVKKAYQIDAAKLLPLIRYPEEILQQARTRRALRPINSDQTYHEIAHYINDGNFSDGTVGKNPDEVVIPFFYMVYRFDPSDNDKFIFLHDYRYERDGLIDGSL